jgi:hypothetical protein
VILAPDGDVSALFPLAWSRTGRVFAYSRPAPQTNRDVWTLSPGERPRPFLQTPRDERAAMFSPDGRFVVYAEKEPGRDEQVYVQPYPGPGARVVVSAGGGIEPVWSPTGREIFYRSIDGRRMMAVDVRTEGSFTAGTPRPLFEGPFVVVAGSFWSNYDVGASGKEFLLVEEPAPPVPRLNVIVRWLEEVKSAGRGTDR